MEVQRVKIKGSFTPLNEVNNKNRTHWSIGAKIKKTETELVSLQCKKMKVVKSPSYFTFHWYISSRHDFDNIRSCAKVILDGMVESGKLPDDNQKWVVGFLGDFFYRVPKGQEKVVVEIQDASTLR